MLVGYGKLHKYRRPEIIISQLLATDLKTLVLLLVLNYYMF